MRTLFTALGNGALSFAISVTVVLTLSDDADGPWERTDLVAAAGLSAFLSGVCASYFGGDMSQLRQKALYRPP